MNPQPTSPDATRTPTFIVIAPTFNHARALAGVLQLLEPCGLPIIVVNDGATDATAAVVAEWIGSGEDELRRGMSHATNLGKAAALRTGFAEAARRGFTHAVTIDTDGQHDPGDVPGLVAWARARPGAIVIGARAIEGVRPPWPSRVGRVISNHLVWLESGVRVTDSQSGMRVYPLRQMEYLSGSAGRYGFETEVLTRAGWRGVRVVETPIGCVYDVPGGRTTHFRIGRDSLCAAVMHARLIMHGLMPFHARIAGDDADPATGSIPRRLVGWFSPRRMWRMARGSAESRGQLAASFGVGLLMATLPLYGVKTAVCLWLSGRFRLHPLVVISTSSLCTPPLGLVFVMLSVCVGSLVLHGSWPNVTMSQIELVKVWTAAGRLMWEWIVGSVIAGIALGVLGYWIARIMLAWLPASSEPRATLSRSALVRTSPVRSAEPGPR